MSRRFLENYFRRAAPRAPLGMLMRLYVVLAAVGAAVVLVLAALA